MLVDMVACGEPNLCSTQRASNTAGSKRPLAPAQKTRALERGSACMRPLAATAAVLLCSCSVVQDASAFGLSSGWRRSATGGMLRPRTAIAQSAGGSDAAAAAAPQQAEARSLALPPRFVEKINVPLDTPFKLEREGPPTAAELEDTNLIKVHC
jgi:hypothetical protein